MKKKGYIPPTTFSMYLEIEPLLATSPGQLEVKGDDEYNISDEGSFLSGSRDEDSHSFWEE